MAATPKTPDRKTVRIPLVGTYNQRTIDGTESLTANLDQRFLNCIFDKVINPVTGGETIFVEKRPGWASDLVVDDGEASTGLIKPQSFNASITAFGNTNSIIYLGTTSLGTISGRAIHFTETILGLITYIMIRSSDGTGWYYASDANDDLTYTADGNNSTTITDIKIAGVNSTAGLYSGQLITGANIPANTRIVSVNSGAFTAVLSQATTGGAFNDASLTKEPIAKILDVDFVTTGESISAFVEMNGYLFYVTQDGNLRNSDLNSVSSYPATGSLTLNMAPDPPRAVARYKDKIVVLGGSSKEAFTDVANDVGSPLQRSAQDFERLGTLDQRSVAVLENEIYFVSSPDAGDIGVYQIDELRTNKISTPPVDRILGSALSSEGAVYASTFRLGGYPYLGLFVSLASENQEALLLETGDYLLLENGDRILLEGDPASVASFIRFLVYNIELKIWSEWDATQATFISGSVAASSNQIVATSRVETDGKIYKIDGTSPVYQDDGASYTAEVRTSKVDFDTQRRKFIHKIRLVCDKQSVGVASLSWSDDDYQTFSTPRDFDLTHNDPMLSACGSHMGGRVYKLTHSANGPFRAEALEITYSEGIN